MSDCSTNVPACAGKFVRLVGHAKGPAIVYSIIASDGVVFDISV